MRVGNEPCVGSRSQIDCLQANLTLDADIGRSPWNEDAAGNRMTDIGRSPWNEDAAGNRMTDIGRSPWNEDAAGNRMVHGGRNVIMI